MNRASGAGRDESDSRRPESRVTSSVWISSTVLVPSHKSQIAAAVGLRVSFSSLPMSFTNGVAFLLSRSALAAPRAPARRRGGCGAQPGAGRPSGTRDSSTSTWQELNVRPTNGRRSIAKPDRNAPLRASAVIPPCRFLNVCCTRLTARLSTVGVASHTRWGRVDRALRHVRLDRLGLSKGRVRYVPGHLRRAVDVGVHRHRIVPVARAGGFPSPAMAVREVGRGRVDVAHVAVGDVLAETQRHGENVFVPVEELEQLVCGERAGVKIMSSITGIR